jgi:WhiB family redox-sensing transcriptional regulator
MSEHLARSETWRQSAACSGMDTSDFYPGDRERGPTLARRERRAKQVCARCPVIQECLAWALDAREPFGVWGGTSAKERARMLQVRDRRGGSRGSRLGETARNGGETQHVIRAG